MSNGGRCAGPCPWRIGVLLRRAKAGFVACCPPVICHNMLDSEKSPTPLSGNFSQERGNCANFKINARKGVKSVVGKLFSECCRVSISELHFLATDQL